MNDVKRFIDDYLPLDQGSPIQSERGNKALVEIEEILGETTMELEEIRNTMKRIEKRVGKNLGALLKELY